jgi:tetratricopeptide (TPR) repeat protein
MRLFIIRLVVSFSLLAQTRGAEPKELLAAASAAEKAGRTEQATRQLQRILETQVTPDVEGQARLQLLRIYQKEQDWREAARQLERLRELAPQDAEYAYQLGAAYQRMSKSAFERMKELDPHSARVQQTFGEQYSVGGDQEKAIAAYRRAIEADPKLAGSHLALAMIYAQAGKADEAKAEISRELEISPNSAIAKQMLRMFAGGKQ